MFAAIPGRLIVSQAVLWTFELKSRHGMSSARIFVSISASAIQSGVSDGLRPESLRIRIFSVKQPIMNDIGNRPESSQLVEIELRVYASLKRLAGPASHGPGDESGIVLNREPKN